MSNQDNMIQSCKALTHPVGRKTHMVEYEVHSSICEIFLTKDKDLLRQTSSLQKLWEITKVKMIQRSSNLINTECGLCSIIEKSNA